jgi:hypothetical protein
MRFAAIVTACVALMFPAVCLGLAYSTVGNEKLPAENYAEWPKLIYSINDPSRVLMFWCNGSEELSYSGDTASLNRVLKKFSLTEAPELHVVLRPGPGQTIDDNGVQKPVDWTIHITGGITRAMVQKEKLESLPGFHPTLTVFVTARVDLAKLKIPRGVKLFELEDLRRRYTQAQTDDNERVRAEAGQRLQVLSADAERPGKDAEEFQQRVAAIREFVERQQKEAQVQRDRR